jgi:hypothetical protein
MRKTLAALVVAAVVPATLALPVVTPAYADPHPVAPRITARALTGVDAHALTALRAQAAPTGALAPAALTPRVLTGQLATQPFQLVGVTWDGTAAQGAGLTFQVRVHDDRTGWGAWERLSPPDGGPDVGSVDARLQRAGTEPLVTDPASGVQVRVDGTGALPAGLSVQLIDPGTSAADDAIGATGPASQASAETTQPTIITRAQWGADESLRNGFAGYSDTIKVGFVHHTTTPNSYTSTAQAAAQIRAIYAYDTNGLHWSDIAYNFLVDKWGNVYEGRAGGVDKPVIGAHTAGFNDESFAVAALGCYDTTCSGSAAPSAALLNGLAKTLAWKLGLSYRDPSGHSVLVSSGITGTNTSHPAGELVTTPTISGHRDVDSTACPGNRLYPYMTKLRQLALAYLKAGFANPALGSTAGAYGGSGPTVTSGVLTPQTWRVDVSDACRGGVVASLWGTASRAAPISTAWKGNTSSGTTPRPGPYRLVMTGGSAGAGPALPWTASYAIDAPAPGPEPQGDPTTGSGRFVPVKPLRLLDTRDGVYPNGPSGRVDLTVLGRAGIPASGVTAVALQVTAVCPTRGTYVSVAPTGSGTPGTSALNLGPGQTRAAVVVVPVGAGGKVSLGNALGTTQLAVDAVGYFDDSAGSGLTAVPLTRVFDTRGTTDGAMGAGETRTIALPTIAGVDPSSITGVVANLTVYSAPHSGYLALWPAGSSWPGTSSLNYPAGQNIDGAALVGVSNGKLQLRNVGSTADVAVDVLAVFTKPAALAGSAFTSLKPTRALDTRVSRQTLGPGGTVRVPVAGTVPGVPTGATAVLVNVTGVAPTATTSLIAWPSDQPTPGGAVIRLQAGDIRANATVVALAADGSLSLKNALGSTDVVLDVMGYFG